MSSYTKVDAFKCDQCGRAFTDEKRAERCCVCEVCGNEAESPTGILCRNCRLARWEEKDRQKLEAAEDVSGQYQGPVFVGDNFIHDGINEAIEEFIEFSDDERPQWAHPAIEDVFALDLQQILETAEENHAGNCEDYEHDRNGYAELSEAVDRYNEANENEIVYWPDYRRKVRLVYDDTNEGAAT